MPFPVEEQYIISTEDKIGLEFPPTFRQKMLSLNGGEIVFRKEEWTLYPFLDKSNTKRFKRTCNDILRETENARQWDGFPNEAIAIGNNGCGDQLILLPDDQSGKLQTTIYCWRHETRTTHKIADDFQEIL